MIHALAFFNAWIAPWIYIACAAAAFTVAIRTLKHEAKHADEMFSILESLDSAQRGFMQAMYEGLAKHKKAIEGLNQADHEIKRVVMMQDAPRLLEVLKRAGERAGEKAEDEKVRKPN